MAKVTSSIPFFVREVVSETTQALNVDLGVPMTVRFPDSDEFENGRVELHFEGGWHFTLRVDRGRGHYGETVVVRSIQCALRFGGMAAAERAEEWVKSLEAYAGPLDWRYTDDKLRFVIEGIALDLLQMNASNRRNGLPTYRWDDPKHPFLEWERKKAERER